MFPYEQSATSMIEEGTHEGVIKKVGVYSNPNGANKLIVETLNDDGILFSHFYTPGFSAFEDLIRVAGEKPKPKGEFDEQGLVNKKIRYTTKITTAKNGNQYCNVENVDLIGEAEPETEKTPFDTDEKKTK